MTQSKNLMIEKLLEDIFFDTEELDRLKREIKQVSLGTLDVIQLKKTILDSRIQFKEEMIHDFLPYYKDQIKRVSLDGSPSPKLLQKLKEREDLLETVALRINTLYQKLQEEQNSNHSNHIKDLSKIVNDTSLLGKNTVSPNESTDQKKQIVVDLMNILKLDPDEKGRVKVKNIMKLYNAVMDLGYEPHMIADANMRHKTDSKEQYKDLIEKRIVIQSSAGRKADEYVLDIAKRWHCKFLANDLYREKEYQKEFGKEWIFANRLTAVYVKGEFFIR